MDFKLQIKKVLLIIPFFKYYFLRKELKYRKHSNFSEGEFISLFLKYFSHSKVMIDVGAHYGESFAPYEKNSWKIYAFEPDPESLKKIRPRLKSTEIFNVAITEFDGENVTLYKSNESTGISSLSSFHPSHTPDITVHTKTLKTFCKEKTIKNIDFLKIDTEGYDLFVLKGFPFEKIRPIIILCEFEDYKTLGLGYNYQDMGNYLIAKGYDVYISEWHPIIKYGIQHKWRSIRHFPEHTLKNTKGWGNFIGIQQNFAHRFKALINDYVLSVKT